MEEEMAKEANIKCISKYIRNLIYFANNQSLFMFNIISSI